MKAALEQVTLETMNFGSLTLMKFELTEDGRIIIDGIGDIKLSLLLDKDMRLFQEMNEKEDSEHQIDMDSLTITGLKIVESAIPLIRVQYAFKQASNFWRSLDGETGTLHRYTKGMAEYEFGKDKWYASAIYTKGACVYW